MLNHVNTFFMRKNIYFILIFTGLFAGCVSEGPMGPEGPSGRDGLDTEIYYSPWYKPSGWNGKSGDWYFDVEDNAINEDIVEAGIILAYMSVPGDVYEYAVRPMPAYALGANWDFLIPDYGAIEFTSDAIDRPGTTGYLFRFVVIPSNIALKSASLKGITAKELKAMPYQEVINKLGIPEK